MDKDDLQDGFRPTESSKEEELERATRLRGFRHGIHDFKADVDLPELRRNNDIVEQNYTHKANSLIDRKTKEMLAIAINVAQGDLISHLQIHFHAAHKAGASAEELYEMLFFLKPWIAFPRFVVGMEAWRSLFRPDLPTIDRVTALE